MSSNSSGFRRIRGPIPSSSPAGAPVIGAAVIALVLVLVDVAIARAGRV